ncbi:hypothetical protein V6N11_005293 [Hibiscus sabdariffa]|uniref:Uncharacterized protein n=2 Tax=Hibiscus sabdariffa TaxID=183260 RepID=A0ABR1ZF35_9ROSI
MALLLFLFLATTLSDGSPDKETIPGHKVLLLGPSSGHGVDRVSGLSCLSWRLAVETNTIIDWDIVPGQCEDYVGYYMLGHQYKKDSAW